MGFSEYPILLQKHTNTYIYKINPLFKSVLWHMTLVFKSSFEMSIGGHLVLNHFSPMLTLTVLKEFEGNSSGTRYCTSCWEVSALPVGYIDQKAYAYSTTRDMY